MSSIYDKLKFNSVITFELYPANIIGKRFEDAKVLALLDKQTANAYIDADTLHPNVYPTLPEGVPDNADEYQYVKLRLPNDKILVVGVPWIKEDSIVVSQKGRLIVTVDNVTPEDRDIILRGISANGYRVSSVSLGSN